MLTCHHVLADALSAVFALVEVRSFSGQTEHFPWQFVQSLSAWRGSAFIREFGCWLVIMNKISRNSLGIYFHRVSVYPVMCLVGILGAYWVFSSVLLWHGWFLRVFFFYKGGLSYMPNTFVFNSRPQRPHKYTYSLYARFTYSKSLFPSHEEGGRKRSYRLWRGQRWWQNCTHVRQWNNAPDRLIVQNVELQINATGLCVLCSRAAPPHLPVLPSEILVFTLDIGHNVFCLLLPSLHKCKQKTLPGLSIDIENKWR